MYAYFCNKCFRLKQFHLHLELYLSTCGHVVCKDCVQPKCVICRRKYKPLRIDKAMPASMAAYFESPLKAYQRFQKILKFQTEQQTLYNAHYTKAMPARIRKYQRELAGYKKLEARLTEQMENEKRRIQQMKTYIAYYERRLQQEPADNYTQNRRGNFDQMDDGLSGRLSRAPTTPTLSTADSSTDSSYDDGDHWIGRRSQTDKHDFIF